MPPILLGTQYRLSRVYSGGAQQQTYNRVILFVPNFKIAASTKFVEGFDANEFIIEGYSNVHSFRKNNITPYMDYDINRFRVIGSEIITPQLRSWLSITIFPWDLKVNEEQDVFSCKIRDLDASNGDEIEAYNSTELGTNTNVQFYDRDVLSVNRQRNILGDRTKLTPTPAPEPITEQILETL